MHWHESNFVIEFNLFSISNCNNLPKLKFVRALKRIEGGCLMFCACLTGWPEDLEKFAQNFEKVAKTVAETKIFQNIFIKVHF